MTSTTELDPARLKRLYEVDAELYLRSLPLEHFMEAPTQATQRQITVNSFEALGRRRPDVHVFSELLIQYPVAGEPPARPARVVPDNMVVVHPTRPDVGGSFKVPDQPVGPILVAEYVSKESVRKDYDGNYRKYEQDLKVPYYLLFYPDADELTLFRLAAGGYVSVRPNENGRRPIPELELEVALLDGWVRFWFRGELLRLPADLEDRLEAEQAARIAAEQRADAAEAENARLRAEIARLRGEPPAA